MSKRDKKRLNPDWVQKGKPRKSHTPRAIPGKADAHGNVTYELRGQLAEEYGTFFMCGYMRQPIDYSPATHILSGDCSLHNYKRCQYQLPSEESPCKTCGIYSAFFPNTAQAEEKPSKLEDEAVQG